MQGPIKELSVIYILRTVGVAEDSKPYLDWVEALIEELLLARPKWQNVNKQLQTAGQILVRTYSGLYSGPRNKEIHLTKPQSKMWNVKWVILSGLMTQGWTTTVMGTWTGVGNADVHL